MKNNLPTTINTMNKLKKGIPKEYHKKINEIIQLSNSISYELGVRDVQEILKQISEVPPSQMKALLMEGEM